MYDCPPCPFSPLSPVLAELQQAAVITSENYKSLVNNLDMFIVQSDNSPEVLIKVADVLRRNGFEEDSNLFAGKQTQPLIHVTVVCYTVQPSCKGHLKASIIIVSFTPTMLGHSECVPEPHSLPTWPPETLACTH